jgi:hypothetical protein
LALVAALGGSWLLATPARADGGASLQTFTAAAEAPVFQMSEDEPSANFHPEGEGELVHTMTTLDTTAGYAVAAPLWPGSSVAHVGGLINLLEPVPGPVASLSDPVDAEARTGTGPPSAALDIPGASMRANASPTTVNADTKSTGADQPGVLTFTSALSHSDISNTGTVLTGNARSWAENISIAGGLVTIGSFSSSTTLTTTGTGHPKAISNTVFSGVKVAGQSVTIDGSGFHVGSGPGSNPVPVQQINQALAGAGMELVYIAPRTVPVGERTFYYGAALLVFWAPPGDSKDNTFTVSVGGAAVLVGASVGGGGALVPPTPSVGPSSGGVVATLPAGAPVPASVSSSVPSPAPLAVNARSSPGSAAAPAAVSLAGGLHSAHSTGVGVGWFVLLALAAITGAVALPLLPGALAAAAVPGCRRERGVS